MTTGHLDEPGAPLVIRLFGPLEVWRSGRPLPRLYSRKGHWLLALLTLRGGAEAERAWLAGTLWPDCAQRQALYNLRRHLSDLRQALGPEAVRLRSPTPRTLCLDLAGAEADVVAFDAVIAQGDAASLEAAVSHYRGPLLEGCMEAWAFQERPVREEAYLQALESLATRARARGASAAAEQYLRRAVAVDPLRETAQRALMQVVAATGNYAAALELYRELRVLLHRELSTEPDPETQALFQQLRAEVSSKAALGARCSASGSEAVASRQAQELSPSPVEQSPRPSAAEHGSEATLTFLFTDIEASTERWEQRPEGMRAALARHDALLRRAIEAHDGAVFKTVGDQFCAAFATASNALAAALAAQRALQQEAWEETGPLHVRMALHTGAAEEREGDYFDPTLNRVARLLDAGHGGQILLSQTTADLVRDSLPEGTSLWDLREHRLKDLARPERIFQLVSPDLTTDFPPLHTRDARPNNLPVHRTPPLGREKEAAAVRDLLLREEVSLVTLTGPGGTGKTRLSLEVASQLLEAFESGVYFVDLAPVRDPDRVASTIGQALGVQETGGRPLIESLRDSLQEKQILLLLDNFEQVLSAAPLVSDLLKAAPRLKVLVTSRERLHLQAEREFPVPPLALPDAKHLPTIPALLQYGAVQLFVERAVAARPDFVLTSENALAVAEICCRLDGLPLAIELAAARIKLFSPQSMLSRLVGAPLVGAQGRPQGGGAPAHSPLRLLTGGPRDLPARQQTLRDTIAWSYELLDENEKQLFRRLSLFVGGCTLEAAEAVCNADRECAAPVAAALLPPLAIDLLDGVASLVDKNLLRQAEIPDGEPRFGMLETIREFGLECLTQSGEMESLRRQHLNYFLELAEAAEPKLRSADPGEWLEKLDRELDNLRVALEWCLEQGEAELELRLAGSLSEFWASRGHWEEGRQWLEGALARSACVTREPDDRLKKAQGLALHGAGTMATELGDHAAARSRLEESVRLGRELGDKELLAWSLFHLFFETGELSVGEESVALFREVGNRRGLVYPLYCLGNRALHGGDYTRARSLYEESLAISRELGDKAALARPIAGLAVMAWRQGDYMAARSFYEETVALRREHDDPWLANYLNALGNVLCDQGELRRAAALFEESLALSRERGYKRAIAGSLVGLGAVAWRQGRYEVARSLCEQGQQVFKEVGDRWGIAQSFTTLGRVAHAQGDHAQARLCHEEGLALASELTKTWGSAASLGPWSKLGNPGYIAECLEGLAGAAGAQGHAERAARVLGAAQALREGVGSPLPPANQLDYDRTVAMVRAALGEASFATAWDEGRALALEQAVAYALAETDDPAAATI